MMVFGLREKTLFFLIGGVAAISAVALFFVVSQQQEARLDLARQAVVRHVELYKAKTLGGIEADLVLARKMADSEVLRQWVRQPPGTPPGAPAMQELASLVRLFSTHVAFVASKPAGKAWLFDARISRADPASLPTPLQTLSRENRDDDWFFQTLGQTEPYNFNLDHNRRLNVTKLWINVVMRDGPEAIGIVGTGIDMNEFINDFVRSKEPGLTSIYLTDDGVIQGHPDRSLIALNAPLSTPADSTTVWHLLGSDEERQALRAEMAAVKAGHRPIGTLTLTLDGKPQIVAVAYVPPLKWYTLAALDAGTAAGDGRVLPVTMALLAAMLLVCALALFIGNRLLLAPLRRLLEGTQRIMAGEHAPALPAGRRDEIGELTSAFAGMAEKLHESQRLVKTNLATISTALQRASTEQELAEILLAQIAPLMGLVQGNYYRMDAAAGCLRLCGAYARPAGADVPDVIAPGEGLLGQCAVAGQRMVVGKLSASYLRVSSVLGETTPGCIALQPVVSAERLFGVFELATLGEFSESDFILLDTLLPVLSMCLEIIERNERTQSLLLATREQASELETRGKEIAKLLRLQQAIFDSAPNGILYVVDGVILRANPRIAQHLGWSVDAMLGKPMQTLFPSVASHDDFCTTAGPSLADGAAAHVEWAFRRKDGSVFVAHVSGQALRMEGAGLAVVWTFEDIDARKRLELATCESDERLRQILQNSPAGVLIMEEGGRLLFANRRIAELLGVSPDAADRHSAAEFWRAPEQRARFLERLHADGQVADFRAALVRTDGTPLEVVVSSMLVPFADGRCSVSWIYDLTGNGVPGEGAA